MSDLPPLPDSERWFLCTKCGSRTCTQATQSAPHPNCAKCSYMGFTGLVGYTPDQMHAYAKAYAAQEVAAERERCAKIADEFDERGEYSAGDAIRAS